MSTSPPGRRESVTHVSGTMCNLCLGSLTERVIARSSEARSFRYILRSPTPEYRGEILLAPLFSAFIAPFVSTLSSASAQTRRRR